MVKVEDALNYNLSSSELESQLENDDFLREYTSACLDELVIEKAFALVPEKKLKVIQKKSRLKLFFFAAAALMVFGFLYIRQVTFPAIGESASVVSLIRNSQEIKLASGSELKSGDIISAGNILLNDGSHLEVAEGSQVKIRFQGAYILTLIHGKVSADVRPQASPMTLECGTTLATVIGTKFDLIRIEDDSLLSVEEGKVKWSRGSEEVFINSGEESISTPNSPLSKKVSGFDKYRSTQLKNRKFLNPITHFLSLPPAELKEFPGAKIDRRGRWGRSNMNFEGILNNRYEMPWFKGLNTEEFTAGVWFKPSQVGGHRQGVLSQRTVILREPKGGGNGWSFIINSLGELEFWYASKEQYWGWTKSPKLKKGEWYMALATVKNSGSQSEITFYLNGQEVSRQNKVYTPVDVQNNRLHIGGMSSQTQLKQQMQKDNMEFEGDIDEFFILPEVLSTDEIKNLYSNGQ